MKSISNSLKRLREEKEQLKQERRDFKIKFLCLYVSIFSYLKANPENQVTELVFGSARKIMIANDGFFFEVCFRYDYTRHKVWIVISEESLSLKIWTTLKLVAPKSKWRIVRISQKRLKYTFRIMRPKIIEELIVILIRYL